ncbi:MAG: C69 family dipeptidase [Candidatus Hatepunaea meridiana]|nr:C69 family dipeptidase [Candidatus Hatepunaea meridiana]
MKNRLFSLVTFLLILVYQAAACTNLLVTQGASVDGSVMITYTCDAEFHPHLGYTAATDYEPDDSLEITRWGGKVLGKVKQVSHTYAVVELMNEHQLSISETTFSGRDTLRNPDGLLHYWDLMQLALQRAVTARDAISIMTDLVADYGYRSTGESFSIADTKEAWIMEMIGPGPGGQGAQWVALKIPDGYISCHANKARIGEFPLDDPKNCLYSDNVISFAIEKGYYNPDSGEPFCFCEAYCPATPKNKRYADARVWSIFRRAAPSKKYSPDHHRAVEGTDPYPLWIKPDKKLSLTDVFSLMRDHYEGTDYDMTKGVDAGPYGCPNRWRPMTWTVDSIEYVWERPISTQQTAFSFVSQSRDWLPDPIGGVFWYGVDDTYTTCYVPLYCGIDNIPKSFTIGSLSKFSWESAWWVFNFVANYANLKYCFMIQDIQAVQKDIEGNLLALQPTVESIALKLAKSNPDILTRYLTDYSINHAEATVARWRELGEHLITKYNDGYIKDEDGRPQGKGYPKSWQREVLRARPDQFRLPKKEESVPESKLVD